MHFEGGYIKFCKYHANYGSYQNNLLSGRYSLCKQEDSVFSGKLPRDRTALISMKILPHKTRIAQQRAVTSQTTFIIAISTPPRRCQADCQRLDPDPLRSRQSLTASKVSRNSFSVDLILLPCSFRVRSINPSPTNCSP